MNAQSSIPVMEKYIHGTGEALVLLPGGLTGWISWIPHAERLSESRKVIRLQLHNVALGLSGEPLPPNYSAAFEVAAFAKTVDNLSLDPFDLAGWSYGGLIALSYAIQNPDRIGSLTLIEPPAFWVLGSRGLLHDNVVAERAFLQNLPTDDVSEEALVAFTHFSGLVPKDVDPRTLPPWPGWLEHRQSLRIGAAAFEHKDHLEQARGLNTPVLLVKGEGSNPQLHEIIDVLDDTFPLSSIITFPGGHAPHIVSMEGFLQSLIHFLQE